MKKYSVQIPIAGYIYIEIEAENEEEVEDIAMGKTSEILGECKFHDDILEVAAYDKLVEGNICYVSPYQIDIEEIED